MERLRAQRAAERAQASQSREALLRYQQGRESDVADRNRRVEGELAELRRVLPIALEAQPFRIFQCKSSFVAPHFNPGPLGVPVIEPRPVDFALSPPTGLMARTPKARADYDAAPARTQAAYKADWNRASQRENERLQKLAAYHNEFQHWITRERARIEAHNSALDDVATRYGYGDVDGVLQFFSVVADYERWPESFPIQRRLVWEKSARQLVVYWQLPGIEVVPRTSRFRYVKSSDQEKSIDRPVTDRRALYRDLIAQCMLGAACRFLAADFDRHVDSIALSGYVLATDPTTGREAEFALVSTIVQRNRLEAVDLRHADPVSCVEGLGGRLSAKPDQLQSVVPYRLPEDVRGEQLRAGEAASSYDDDVNLLEKDPLQFEQLVAELFKCRGFDVMTTSRSGDGGVDAFATDADPLTGGKIVIQAKRHRNTVSPAVVRELYGTVIAQGAAKGILVTTSKFGPDAHRFAENLPLKLIEGQELVQLLRTHGLPGHIGGLQPVIAGKPGPPATPARQNQAKASHGAAPKFQHPNDAHATVLLDAADAPILPQKPHTPRVA
jgi:restriction system protein